MDLAAYLTQRTKLVAKPGGSFMHEYVHGTLDEVFDEDAA